MTQSVGVLPLEKILWRRDEAAGFQFLAIILSVIFVITGLLTFTNIRERVVVPPKQGEKFRELFINAGGIILEIGGALQHGAVVAREYGIPCVTGLDRATEFLSDGQLVEVDGSNGTVRILE